MKTRIIMLVFILLIVCGCEKKRECVEWLNSDYDRIQISRTEYNRACDVSKKFFGFEFYSENCDDTQLQELLSYNKDTIMVFGVLCTGVQFNNAMVLSTPGETGYLSVLGIPRETAEYGKTYRVTGVLHLDIVRAGLNYKHSRKTSTNDEPDKALYVYLESLCYDVYED